jgi:unsaturated rhamnogalacturonyl hydrolase
MAGLLSFMPEDHPYCARVLETSQHTVRGFVPVQGGRGRWHQMLDKPGRYLETSASAMFTSAIAPSVNRGWLSPAYGPAAQAGWQGIAKRVGADGRIDAMGMGTTAAYDAVYYYNHPADPLATHGYGLVLMAGGEVITMLRSFDINYAVGTFPYRLRKH